MHYTSRYQSPLGEILLAADNIGLTGLWFYGQKYFALHLDESHEEKTSIMHYGAFTIYTKLKATVLGKIRREDFIGTKD